jgi:hypothetical protein
MGCCLPDEVRFKDVEEQVAYSLGRYRGGTEGMLTLVTGGQERLCHTEEDCS